MSGDDDLRELAARHEADLRPSSGKSSRHTRVVSQEGLNPPKRKTFADTIRDLFAGGEFIVADDPDYRRRVAVRSLGLLTIALGTAFVTLAVLKVFA